MLFLGANYSVTTNVDSHAMTLLFNMRELTKLQTAIIKANDEWEEYSHERGDFHKEYLQDYCKEAYLTLLGI